MLFHGFFFENLISPTLAQHPGLFPSMGSPAVTALVLT